VKNLCLILLTVFFICKSTDVVNLLLAKDKVTLLCSSDNCDTEKTEIEKIVDEQQYVHSFSSLQYHTAAVYLKTVFSYAVPCENEILKNLFSPPPEYA
jgi:hypothetical protein